MKSCILLFRGINVGGNNLIPMKELKSILGSDGYENVKTYIQSGNVVLRLKSNPCKRVGDLVETNYGFRPEILAFEKNEFENIIKANPYPSNEGKKVHFFFCVKKPKLNVSRIESYLANGEEYELKDNVFYLHAPTGIGRSKLVSNIESYLGTSCTGRNLNTVLKLKEMVECV